MDGQAPLSRSAVDHVSRGGLRSGERLERLVIGTQRNCRSGMSIPNKGSRKVRPNHPGEMLREDFLPDYRLTVSGCAKTLGVSRQTVNEMLRERRAVSPELALRLSRLFGNSPEFWLNRDFPLACVHGEYTGVKRAGRSKALAASHSPCIQARCCMAMAIFRIGFRPSVVM